jgi:peptidoglycan/LPS O-acetylase OafA/YrhL
MGSTSDRFENINLLRAFAATAVVVYHVIEFTKWKSFPIEGPLLTFRIGWIGVDLFFVISGFVIAGSALALHRKNRDGFRRTFWARRLSRIVPLYVLTGALWIVLVEPSFFRQPTGRWIGHLLAHITFTHNLFPATFDSIDGVNWTIGIEMQFYLLVALLIPWIARTPGWRIWLYCILIAWTWRGTTFYAFAGQDDPYRLFKRIIQLPGTLDEFGAGIFLAKMIERRRGAAPTLGVAWTIAAIIAGTISVAIYWQHATYWNQAPMVIFWRTSLGVFFLCVVAAAVHLPSFADRSATASTSGTSSRSNSASPSPTSRRRARWC